MSATRTSVGLAIALLWLWKADLTAQVFVSPDGGSLTVPPSASGQTASFSLTGLVNGQTYWLEWYCSGSVMNCTSPQGSSFQATQYGATWPITFNAGSEQLTSGKVILKAFGPGTSDSGYINVELDYPSGPPANTTYELAYVDVDSVLDKITDPAGRVLNATVTGGRLTALTDPDGETVHYDYDGHNRLTTRTNRRSHTTTYRYMNGLRVTAVEIPISASELAITSFTNWDERGLFIGLGGTQTATDPSQIYTMMDGPRSDTDVLDHPRFWVDRWGAPTKIRDALGLETIVTRGNPTVPALVTEVQAPNGFVTRATYDGRGNVLMTTAVNPYGDGADAVTRSEWDGTWDFVTKIVPPEKDSMILAYDPANGNRLWQQDARGSASRVNFNYANPYKLLSSVVRPGAARDSLRYSTALGNPDRIRTPLGFLTAMYQDSIGRDTLVLSPAGNSGGPYQRRQSWYDAMNRIWKQHAVGPAMSGVAAQTLAVRNFYDAEGNVDSVMRWSSPDPAQIGQIVTRWTYDWANRPVTEVAPDGLSSSTEYDAAGNAIQVVTRRFDPWSGAPLALTMRYDALNRLQTRVVPEVRYPHRPEGIPVTHAGSDVPGTPYPLYPNDGGSGYKIALDSTVFTYDTTGGIETANNAAAQISRTYHPNGALETEMQRVATVSGGDFTQHEYTLEYVYDLNGRRTDLIHPAKLSADAPRDRTTWAYSDTTGQLAAVTDLRGNVFELSYNFRNELTGLIMPGGITEDFGYDDDGRLTTHHLVNGSGSDYAWPQSYLRNAKYEYDARGKLKRIENTAGTADTLATGYSGLGHLVRDTLLARGEKDEMPVEYVAIEEFAYDAFGNIDESTSSTTTCVTPSSCTNQPGSASHLYATGVGRLLRAAYYHRTDTLVYDKAGNAEWQKTVSGIPRQDRASYYGADGWLMAADRRSVVGNTYRSDFEEYRYDALGRRVWVRSRENCAGEGATPFCRLSRIRRIVWDGAQELYEIQMPGDSGSVYLEEDTAQVQLEAVLAEENGWLYDPNPFFGRVAYTPGTLVDQPLSVIRFGFRTVLNDHEGTAESPVEWDPLAIMPHFTVRGLADVGTFEDGGIAQCTTVSGVERCVWRDWPAELYAYARSQEVRDAWHGSLLADKADAAGTYYRRNRVYDPETGRFTQEDPIGLAGGVNSYAFAGGDPVNFGDPFGLWCQRRGSDELRCEDIAPGDFWTISEFLGGESGRSAFETFQSAGLTSWSERTCQGGFEHGQCSALAQTHAKLIVSDDALCSMLGTRASRRFERGWYRLHQGLMSDDDLGWATPRILFWGGKTKLSSELFGTGEHAGELLWMVAHEEMHHYLWAGGLLNNAFGEGPANAAGDRCT